MRALGSPGTSGDIRAMRYRRTMEDGERRDPMKIAEALLDVWEILPTQLRGGSQDAVFSQPEFRLWSAMAIQAVLDYLDASAHGQRDQQDAERWLFADEDGPATFRWITGFFGIDTDAARQHLRRLRERAFQRRRVRALQMARTN